MAKEKTDLPDLSWDSEKRYIFVDRMGTEWVASCKPTVVINQDLPIEGAIHGRTQLNWMLIRRDDPSRVQLMQDRDARLIFIDWREV